MVETTESFRTQRVRFTTLYDRETLRVDNSYEEIQMEDNED